MKKIILSAVVASMALTTAASAIENVKANGEAKLIYEPNGGGTYNGTAVDNTLFDQNKAQGQASVKMGISADLSTNLSGAVEVSAVSTLGLENSLVDDTMATYHTTAGNTQNGDLKTDDQFWISQAYFSYKMGNTTAKVGLQELNTPFAFTEKWNVVNNTFQAMVLVNNDIKDVTLVGAYVGKSNGSTVSGSTVAYDGKFSSIAEGVYAVGAMTKIAGINASAWYYDMAQIDTTNDKGADAYWLEADTKVSGVFLGAQYARTNVDAGESLNAWAVKAGTDISTVHVFGAYSQVSDDTSGTGVNANFTNKATNDKTKLYTGTASIWADGAVVGIEDTTAWKLGASTKISDITLGASYTNVDYGQKAANSNGDAEAWDISAATKVGPVGLKAIYTEFEDHTSTGAINAWDVKTLRVIATAKF
jgi:hypothetical protein